MAEERLTLRVQEDLQVARTAGLSRKKYPSPSGSKDELNGNEDGVSRVVIMVCESP